MNNKSNQSFIKLTEAKTLQDKAKLARRIKQDKKSYKAIKKLKLKD